MTYGRRQRTLILIFADQRRDQRTFRQFLNGAAIAARASVVAAVAFVQVIGPRGQRHGVQNRHHGHHSMQIGSLN